MATRRTSSSAKKQPAGKRRAAAAVKTSRSKAASTARRGTAKRGTAKRGTAKRATAKRTTAKRSTVKRGTTKRTALTLLIGTRKGAFFLRSDAARKSWAVSQPLYLGHIIYHMVADPRNTQTLMIAAKTGHLGPTVFRSLDGGKIWNEATQPPAFPKVEGDEKARSVENVFWLSPGHVSEPGTWYAGTSPPGLFRSEDNGATWEPVSGFNDHPMYSEWTKIGATPGGQMVHSVRIDPRDPEHMYMGISVGGTFETLDQGRSWHPLNNGIAADFLPDQDIQYGHDPHCIVISGVNPNKLYQQNHCGIYSLERPATRWTRIGDNMPKQIGDIGFPIVVHPRDENRIWIFPMDGSTVWPRTSVGGKPVVFTSRNGGKTWTKQNAGLPPRDAYFTVKRQAMTIDSLDPAGLYFGTSGGEVWGSRDEGKTWSCLVRYLPEIYSLAVLEG